MNGLVNLLKILANISPLCQLDLHLWVLQSHWLSLFILSTKGCYVISDELWMLRVKAGRSE